MRNIAPCSKAASGIIYRLRQAGRKNTACLCLVRYKAALRLYRKGRKSGII